MVQESVVIGHLLRADARFFTVGTRAQALEELQEPLLGSLCVADGQANSKTYGLIANIQVLDDGLVNQLVSEGRLKAEQRADNRYNRNQPVELAVITLGFQAEGRFHHRLPGQVPLALQTLRLCGADEGFAFCSAGKFSYLRHILSQTEFPDQELIVAHINQLNNWQPAQRDPKTWYPQLMEILIRSLRSDYDRLTQLLDALSDLEQSWN